MCMCVVRGMAFCLFSHLGTTVQVCRAEESSGHGHLNRTSDMMCRASFPGWAGTGGLWHPPPKVWPLGYEPHSPVFTPHQWVCFTVEEETVTF